MSSEDRNHLFPVFLKLETLPLLLVGGGAVGAEKLGAVLANAPDTEVRLVAGWISEEVKALAAAHPKVSLHERMFEPRDLHGVQLVLVAVNDPEASRAIRAAAKERGLLVNVADQPLVCDFYLGSIVQKGHLKIAISTNGKSPTVAKRLKEVFQELLPPGLNDILGSMTRIRARLKGDFRAKVEALDRITRSLADGQEA